MPSAARVTTTARSPATTPTSASSRWEPGGERIAAVRGRRNRFDLVLVARPTARSSRSRPGAPGAPRSGRPPATSSRATRTTPRRPSCAGSPPGGAPHDLRAGPALGPARAPRRARGRLVPLVRRPRDPRLPLPPGERLGGRAGRRGRLPHGGPTDAYIDDHDPRAQYFLAKGYAWLAVNFRGSTGYGRDFERLNHGTWGVDDTKDCLAAADYLRSLDWVDGDRLAIIGGSYGSYMATLAVTDDPEHRYRCAAAMYGDVDLLTSWAQGDRLGVQDLERMMGPPRPARAAYRAASAVHRLGQRRGADPHRPRRARRPREPGQSEEHVAELRPPRQDVRVRHVPRRRPTDSCAPGRIWTSTGASSGSSTGT